MGGGHPAVTPSLLVWSGAVAVMYGIVLSNVVTAVAERNVRQPVSSRHVSWATAIEPAEGTRRIRLGRSGRSVVVAGLGLGLAPVLVADPPLITAAYQGALLCVLVAVSVVDAWEYRIPDRIVFPAIGVTVALALAVLVGRAVNAPVDGVHQLHPLSALVGAGCFALLIGVPHVVRPDAMGLGDVKLAVLLGAAIGLHRSDAIEAIAAVGWAVALAAAAGLLAAVVAQRAGRGDRSNMIPFGPPLSLGTWLVIVVSL